MYLSVIHVYVCVCMCIGICICICICTNAYAHVYLYMLKRWRRSPRPAVAGGDQKAPEYDYLWLITYYYYYHYYYYYYYYYWYYSLGARAGWPAEPTIRLGHQRLLQLLFYMIYTTVTHNLLYDVGFAFRIFDEFKNDWARRQASAMLPAAKRPRLLSASPKATSHVCVLVTDVRCLRPPFAVSTIITMIITRLLLYYHYYCYYYHYSKV